MPDAPPTAGRTGPPLRWEAAGLAAILLLGLGLRAWSLGAGLPGAGLLSPDEDTVVPKALRLLRVGSVNPDWFLYPSLYLILLAGALGLVGLVAGGPGSLPFASEAAYAWDPTPYILTGRLLSLAAGLALVVATWLLGRRLAGRATGLMAAAVVAVAPVTVEYSRVAVTDMTMTALLTAGLVLLVGAAQGGGRRRLLGAAALIGLAASAKYNAGLAVVPLAATAVGLARAGGASWARAARAALAPAGVALAAFVAGTPASLFDPATFAGDFWRQNRIVADGWLGFEATSPGWAYNLHPVLSGTLGVGLLALALAGVALALVRRTRADLVLAPFALLYFAYVSTWNAHFARYLLPIVPVLAVLGARAGVEAVRALRARGRRPAAAAAAVLLGGALALPAAGAVALVRDQGRRDLRLDAARMVAAAVPRGAFVVTDPLGPPLVDQREGRRLAAGGLPVHWLRVIRLETPRPGARADGRRDVDRLRRGGIRWVITSDGISDRVLAAARRYPEEARFYRDLRRRARLVARVPRSLGPGVELWDIDHGPGSDAPARTARTPAAPAAGGSRG